MFIVPRIATVSAAAAALCAASVPASAHHVMDGNMPGTFMEGLLSGLGHPIIGIDHLLFIIGVGLLAGMTRSKFTMPLAFVLGTLGGATFHLSGMNIAFAEIAILASVALMAIAVFRGAALPALPTALLVAAAGLFHGYAYAESIFGAQPAPLSAYLVGFAIIQFAIAAGAATLVEQMQRRRRAMIPAGMRVAGGVMAAFVLITIGQMAVGA